MQTCIKETFRKPLARLPQSLCRAILIAIAVITVVQAQTECFPSRQLPQFFYNTDTNSGTSYATSTVAAESIGAVFVGGRATEAGTPTAWIMKTNYLVQRVQWRRFYRSDGMDTITAMVMSPDDKSIVVVGNSFNGGSWSVKNFIFVIRSDTGGHINDVLKLTLGQTGLAEHKVFDGGLQFTNSGNVFIAFFQVSPTLQTTDNGSHSGWAGRQLVGSYKVATGAMNWLSETDALGYSATLAYRNFCAGCGNIYVGGSSFSASTANFSLRVTRLKEDGTHQTNQGFNLNTGHTSKTNPPYIDHMYLDSSTGQDWLFGTSRSIRAAESGNQVYFWKVRLDATTHDPISSTAVLFKPFKSILSSAYVSGVRPQLDGGDIHMTFVKADGSFRYYIFNWSQGARTAAELFNGVSMDSNARTVFVGSRRETTIGDKVVNRWQGYTGLVKQTFQSTSAGVQTLSQNTATIMGLLDEDNCLQQVINVFDNENAKTAGFSFQVESPAWRPCQLAGQASATQAVTAEDMTLAGTLQTDNWCANNTPAITTVEAGQADPVCLLWDGVYQSIPFVPNKVIAPQGCTDVAPTWIYKVETGSFSTVQDYLKVSVDAEAGLVWVKAMPGSPSPGISYTITITGMLPTGQSASFTLHIIVSACMTAPPIVVQDQIYAVGTPMSFYDPPDFTVSGDPNLCPAKLLYANTVTLNNFVSDSGGDGKYLSWQTNDNTNIALYTVTIRTVNACSNAALSYTLEVISPCSNQLLQIDPLDLKFTSPALVQNLSQPALTFDWSEADVDFEYPATDCGPIEFELLTQAETVPDPAVITPDRGVDPRLISVQTDDLAKEGTYPLRIRVKLVDWPSNPGATKDFTIQVRNICEVAPFDITPSAPPVDVEYTVGQSAVQTLPMDSFVWLPGHCAGMYKLVVTPDPGDITTFTFDEASLTLTVETTDLIQAGVYTVETRAVTLLGVDTGIGNSFKVTIIDPCDSAILSFSSSILPDPFEYVLFGTAEIQSIAVSDVKSSETTLTCPPIILTVVKDDLTPIDSDIFVHNPTAETLATYSEDKLKIGLHTMKILAQYSMLTKYSVFSHDFIVTVIDPCLDHAVLSPSPQTNPPEYSYIGSTDFTLNPFSVFPTICAQIFSCVTQVGSVDICSIPGVSTFDTATGSHQLGTIDKATYVPGVYTLQITSTVGSVSSVVSFDLTLVDPCPTASISLNPSPFLDETEDLGAAETTQSWDLASLYSLDTLVNCGSIELEFYLSDGSQTPLNPAIFEDRRGTPNTLARKFVTDQTFVGTYQITYSVFLTDFPTVKTEQPAPFTVTIVTSCISAGTFDPSVLIDQEYTLTDSSLDYTFVPFQATPSLCKVTYTYSVSEASGEPVVTAFSSLTQTFTFDHTADLNPLVDPLVQFKDYTVTVTGTTGILTPKSVSQTFNLRVKNPCFDPSFVTIEISPLPTNTEYILFDHSPSSPFTFSHAAFSVKTFPTQHALCGALTYDATFESSPIDGSTVPMAYDSGTNDFAIYSEDYSLLGLKSITVAAYLTNYASITTPAPLSTHILIVDPCIDNFTFSVPTQIAPSPYYYTGNAPELVFETVPFETSPSHCAANTTYSSAITAGSRTDLDSVIEANGVGGNTVGAFDASSGRFTFQSIDIANFQPGTFVMQITGTSGAKVASFTIDLVLVNPCFTVDLGLKPSPLVDAIYALGEPAMEQTWRVEDLIAPLTQVDCGPVAVEFFNSGVLGPLNSALFEDDRTSAPVNQFRTLQNNDELTYGPYPVRYRVFFTDYPLNVSELPFPFTITIVMNCANPQSLTPSVLVDQEYTITDTIKTYTVPAFTFSPTACDLVYSFIVAAPDGQFAVTFDSDQSVRQFSFFNGDRLSLAGPSQTAYTVTVKAVLGTSNSLEATASFQLVVKNPCIDAAYVNIDKVSLPAGLQYDLYSFDESLGFTFVHDPFVVTTQPTAGHTLCGDVHYNVWFDGTLVSDLMRPLRYDTLTRTFDFYSQDTSLVGLRTFEVQGYFKDYPLVTSSSPNLVEIIEIFDPCARPASLTDPGQIESREYFYTKGGPPFRVDSFIVDPPVCDVSYECISASCLTDAVRFKPDGSLVYETIDLDAYPPGEIEFTIRGTVGTLVPIQTVTTIKLTLVNPCHTAKTSFKSQFPIEDMRYVLGRPEMTQEFEKLFQLETQVDCGPINLEFVYVDGSPIDETLFAAPSTDTDSRVFKVFQQNDSKSVGIYKISYRATLDLYPYAPTIELDDPFTVTIEQAPSPSVYVFSVIPDWMSALEDQYVTQGEFLNYTMGEYTNQFGTETTVGVKIGSAGLFTRYDPTERQIIVNGTKSTTGIYKITVEAIFTDPKGQTQFFSKSFNLHVNPVERNQFDPAFWPEGNVTPETGKNNSTSYIVTEISETGKIEVLSFDKAVTETEMEEVVVDGYILIKPKTETKEGEENASLSNFKVQKMDQPQPMSKERPIPYIVDFSQTGVMKIGWDRLMKTYNKPKEIPSTKIAVEPSLLEESIKAPARRQLASQNVSEREIREEVWFKEKKAQKYQRMLLLDALQVRIVKDVEEALLSDSVTEFRWDVIQFNKDFIWLQINFENPETLDTFSSEDYITVTFWGVEFFKSHQGIEVEFGTKLEWKITRQISLENKRQIDESIMPVLDSALVTGMIPIIFLIGLGGSLLPTWMFLNSLQLIVHVPMIDAHLPASLHYFLVNYLSVIRLNSEQIGSSVEAWQKEEGVTNYKEIKDENSSFSVILNMCGYKQSSSRNLIIFLVFAVAMLLAVTGIFFWQFHKSCHKKNRRTSKYGEWTLNFSLRFVYEIFLELCICVSINLATHKASVVSLLPGLIILAMVGLLVSLLWKGGPYTVPNSYQKHSLLTSFWGKRPLCPDNCAQLTKVYDQTKKIEEQLEDKESQLIIDVPEQHVQKSSDKEPDEDSFSFGDKSRPSLHVSIVSKCAAPSEKREQYWCEGGSMISLKQQSLGKIRNPAQLVKIKDEARLRSSLSDSVQPSQAYKTLFYGLRKNHPHNMAVVHPLAFVVRRILFAVVIFCLVREAAFFGAVLLLATCLVMMAFVLVEAQWERQLINGQHLVNECAFYLLCISLILFNGVIFEAEQVQALSWLMILSIVSLIIFNVLVVLYDSWCYIRLLYKRHRLGVVRGMAQLKAHLRQKTYARSQASKKRESTEVATSRCLDEKVRENQVIDEEQVKSESYFFPDSLSHDQSLSLKDGSGVSNKCLSERSLSAFDTKSKRDSPKLLSLSLRNGQPGCGLLVGEDSRKPGQDKEIDTSEQPVLLPLSKKQLADLEYTPYDQNQSNEESLVSFVEDARPQLLELKSFELLSTQSLRTGEQTKDLAHPKTTPIKAPLGILGSEEEEKVEHSIIPFELLEEREPEVGLVDSTKNTPEKLKITRNNSLLETPSKAIRRIRHLSVGQKVPLRDLRNLRKMPTVVGQQMLGKQQSNLFRGSGTPQGMTFQDQSVVNNGLVRRRPESFAPEQNSRSVSAQWVHILREQNLDRAPSELDEANQNRNAFMGYSRQDSLYQHSQCSARPTINHHHSQRQKSYSPDKFQNWQRVDLRTRTPNCEVPDKTMYKGQLRSGRSSVSLADQRSNSTGNNSMLLAGLNVLSKIDAIIASSDNKMESISKVLKGEGAS